MRNKKFGSLGHRNELEHHESDFSIVWIKPSKKLRGPTFLEERATNNLVTERLTIGNYLQTNSQPLGNTSNARKIQRKPYQNPILASELETRIYRKLEIPVAGFDEDLTSKPGFPDQLCCSICLFPFIDPVTADPCYHVYCKACIMKWIQTKPDQDENPMYQPSKGSDFQKCPICRCEIDLLKYAFEVRQKLFNCRGSCAIWKQNEAQTDKNLNICDWAGNGIGYADHVRKGCFPIPKVGITPSEPRLGKRKSQQLDSHDEGPKNPKQTRKPKQKAPAFDYLDGSRQLVQEPSAFGMSLGNALYSLSKKEMVISDDEALQEVDFERWEQAVQQKQY